MGKFEGLVGKELRAQVEHDEAQYAEFMAARDRLLERINATQTDITRLRSHVAETRRDFDLHVGFLRSQIAALVPESQAQPRSPTVPPPTPA